MTRQIQRAQNGCEQQRGDHGQPAGPRARFALAALTEDVAHHCTAAHPSMLISPTILRSRPTLYDHNYIESLCIYRLPAAARRHTGE
jgi:hypothetical protein